MIRHLDAKRLNIQALAETAATLSDSTSLQSMERLAPESIGSNTDNAVNWKVAAEMRSGASGQMDVWMHIEADVALALTCQRCMAASSTPIAINQWYRFVATEEVAIAEDDAAEEDLLVMTPQFDVLNLIEDELLMALPLVPMHEVCPAQPAFSAGEDDLPDVAAVKPNLFAALAQLKKLK